MVRDLPTARQHRQQVNTATSLGTGFDLKARPRNCWTEHHHYPLSSLAETDTRAPIPNYGQQWIIPEASKELDVVVPEAFGRAVFGTVDQGLELLRDDGKLTSVP